MLSKVCNGKPKKEEKNIHNHYRTRTLFTEKKTLQKEKLLITKKKRN